MKSFACGSKGRKFKSPHVIVHFHTVPLKLKICREASEVQGKEALTAVLAATDKNETVNLQGGISGNYRHPE